MSQNMMTRVLVLCGVIHVFLVGCASQDIRSPLPPSVSVVAPGPDIPEPVAAFSGIWRGRTDWGDLALVVERILPAYRQGMFTAYVLLSWGAAASRGEKDGFVRSVGSIGADQVLHVGPFGNGGRWTYSMSAGRQTIVSEYHGPNATNQIVIVHGTLWRTRIFPDQ